MTNEIEKLEEQRKKLREQGIYVGVEIPWYSEEGKIVVKEEDGFGWWVVADGYYDETWPIVGNYKTYEEALKAGIKNGESHLKESLTTKGE